MKKIVYLFSLIFTLMLLLSSCDGFETKKYTITLDNESYRNRITVFKFYVGTDKESATNLLAGSPISYRSKRVFEGLAEENRSYSWVIEYENGDTRRSRYPDESLLYGTLEKYEADTTIKSDPGEFLTYRVRNALGSPYEIHYIVLQPAGLNRDCMLDSGDYPVYDMYQNYPINYATFNRLTNSQSISIEDGEAALYDIFVIAWFPDTSRPGGGDYYYAVDRGDNDKGVNLKRGKGYLLTQANRWMERSDGSVTSADLEDGYWNPSMIKLKNKLLQNKSKIN